MKKFINIFVIALALATVIWLGATKAEAATVESGPCGENLTWTLDDQGVLTISGTGAMTNWPYQETPWYINRSEIKTVVIATGVTHIGDQAFSDCMCLTSVSISETVDSIIASICRM